MGAAAGVALIVATMPISFRRLRAVRQAETPVLVALEAIVLLVTMLVLGFASVYYAINLDGDQFNDLVTRLDSVYFTVVTLSTVGYGDIVATGELARFLVILQILMNLAFLGIVVRVMARAAGATQ
jgi:voltage-gated potassium channel Kch